LETEAVEATEQNKLLSSSILIVEPEMEQVETISSTYDLPDFMLKLLQKMATSV
jgi:hypothetical protein